MFRSVEYGITCFTGYRPFSDEISADNDYPMVRYIKTPLLYNFHAPQTDIPGIFWKAMTPENVMSFSALVYFFAKDYFQKTKVPVGIINSSVGGSPIEAWISEEGLKPFPYYLNENVSTNQMTW